MSSERRPSYPRHTIVEALCEIRFAITPEKGWNANRPGPLYKELSEDYPNLEPVNEADLHLEFTPEGPQQRVQPRPPKIRFSNEQANELVQVSQSLFSFNLVNKYENWDYMKRRICTTWSTVFNFVKPLKLTRIGLRYINRIPRPPEARRVGDWLQSTAYIPEAILTSSADFKLIVEASAEDHIKGIVKLADVSNNERPCIIYDIDMIQIEPVIENMKNIDAIVEALHARVEEEFFAAQKPRLEQYMKMEEHDAG